MAGSPSWKVYAPTGEYVAACKLVEDAAAIVALHGDGAKIKHGHGRALWTEGAEGQPAAESYDYVAQTVLDRHLGRR